jgi:LSD1 subclass zinc finger protein
MPIAVRCPSCHAPLPGTPGPEGIKCNYCGTLVQATRYMPAPGLQPPVIVPPPQAPFGAGKGAEPRLADGVLQP